MPSRGYRRLIVIFVSYIRLLWHQRRYYILSSFFNLIFMFYGFLMQRLNFHYFLILESHVFVVVFNWLHCFQWARHACVCILRWLFSSFEYIVFKITFLNSAVRKPQLTLTMLTTKFPLTFVYCTVSPIELAVSMSHVIFISTIIVVATFPFKGTLPMLFIF